MILDVIVENKRVEVAGRKAGTSVFRLKEKITGLPPPRDFANALRLKPAIIAEIKRRSPSQGVFRSDFDPAGIAGSYQRNGAAAISVLTDEAYFGGSDADIAVVKNAVRIPVLRKEFIIDPWQILETRAIGADALLLIAALLTEAELRDYRQEAESLGLAVLVEAHNREELDAALSSGARIIGVNNRDLRTFSTDVGVSLALAPFIPHDRIAVSESGIESAGELEMLGAAGFQGFLIGGALVAAGDVGAKLRELLCRSDKGQQAF